MKFLILFSTVALLGCATHPPGSRGFAVGADALDVFDGKRLSYTYENGKHFTNQFEGNVRVSAVKRGVLREKVTVTHLGYERYLVVWTDDNMGNIVQIVDLDTRTIRAVVPLPSGPAIWTAEISAFD